MKFESIKLGYEFPEIVVDIDQEIIDRAALAHLDFNPVHTNIEWAARAQVFGTSKTVAHGMFTMSGMTSVVIRHWTRDWARVVAIDAKLTKPVPVNSVVTSSAVVSELHPRDGGAGLVVVRTKAVDQDGDIVAVGSVTVAVEK